MPNASGKVYTIMSVESIAIAALLVVSIWHHFADLEQSHVALVDDSARKLRHQLDDAKLLSASLAISHIPILRQGCINTANALSTEVDSRLWDTKRHLWASDDFAQWTKIRQLSQLIVPALQDPDKIVSDVTQFAKLKANMDVLRSELEAIDEKQSHIWNSKFDTTLHLSIAQQSLLLVVFLLYQVLFWSMRRGKSKSDNAPRT